MKKDSVEKLTHTTIALHWSVAIFMIGLLALGIYMVEVDDKSLYSWHKSFGILALGFIVLRVLWRMRNGWPVPVSVYSKIEQALSKITHWALILGTLALPISGMIMSYFSGRGLYLFGLELAAANPVPDNPRQVIPYNENVAEFFGGVHEIAGYVLIVFIVLHIAGAFKHHIIDKDNTLKRMMR